MEGTFEIPKIDIPTPEERTRPPISIVIMSIILTFASLYAAYIIWKCWKKVCARCRQNNVSIGD